MVPAAPTAAPSTGAVPGGVPTRDARANGGLSFAPTAVAGAAGAAAAAAAAAEAPAEAAAAAAAAAATPGRKLRPRGALRGGQQEAERDN
jgi:hypothetical protein